MKIHCQLGRIAPVEVAPEAELQGVLNAKRWHILIEYDGSDSAMVPLKLLDWRTGRPITPKMKLFPDYSPLSRSAAQATIFFPIVEDDKLFVAIEPLKVSADPDVVSADPIRILVRVDALAS